MGISYDSPEDNKAWANAMQFAFPLLSDPDRTVAKLLDVKRPKAHPMAFLPRRVTYLIDPDGVITRAYDVGRNIKGHAQHVLTDLRALTETDA